MQNMVQCSFKTDAVVCIRGLQLAPVKLNLIDSRHFLWLLEVVDAIRGIYCQLVESSLRLLVSEYLVLQSVLVCVRVIVGYLPRICRQGHFAAHLDLLLMNDRHHRGDGSGVEITA